MASIPFAGPMLYLILRPPETLAERYERALEEEALLQEIEERPRCHNCTRNVLEQWVVCPTCYVELKKQCVGCTSLLELGWKVCPHCATEQPEQMRPLNKKLLRQQIKTKGQVVIQSPAALPASILASSSGNKKDVTETQTPRVKRRYRSVTVGKNGKNTEPLPGDYVVGRHNPTIVSMEPMEPPTAEELARLEQQLGGVDTVEPSSTVVPIPNVSSADITVMADMSENEDETIVGNPNGRADETVVSEAITSEQ